MSTKIEWTDATWNPVTGCTPVSEGCAHCYAAGIAKRFWGTRRFNDVQFHEDRLDQPLRWRKARMVFVNSMGDLFHEKVPCETITKIFDVMCSWRWPSKAAERDGDESLLVDPGHCYQVLTKRPSRIGEWLNWVDQYWPGDTPFNVTRSVDAWPKHVWLGVTVESPEYEPRINLLAQRPAAIRFVSIEPMLSPVNVAPFLNQIQWCIAGCETGPGRRLCELDWIKSIVDQCHAAQVPVFVKAVPLGRGIIKNPDGISAVLDMPIEQLRQYPAQGRTE